MRINILYLLDNLCEASLMHQSQAVGTGTHPQGQAASYVEYVSRDLMRIVELVVPDNRDGLVNLMSTRQVFRALKRINYHQNSRLYFYSERSWTAGAQRGYWSLQWLTLSFKRWIDEKRVYI